LFLHVLEQNLEQYVSAFEGAGYDSVSTLQQLNEQEFKTLCDSTGMKPGHAVKLKYALKPSSGGSAIAGTNGSANLSVDAPLRNFLKFTDTLQYEDAFAQSPYNTFVLLQTLFQQGKATFEKQLGSFVRHGHVITMYNALVSAVGPGPGIQGGGGVGTTSCKYPQCTRVVWVDKQGKASDFCSVFHRDDYKNVSSGRMNGGGNVVVHSGGGASAGGGGGGASAGGGGGTCQASGCSRPVFVDSKGTPSRFCSNTCKNK